ncbi:hypothetical protein [Pseudoalteromonas luteoviolacea]|uniref:Uncharacterized protein n=1 Tax=Pseudoalteromonas luteoviolacea DSM 6061 TaxID=1365250 RepID=A0A166VSG8_9GAMM|nr:hypothetical protein [Pseudoalteromonas luteoviolacea]KZN33649.1 hypothetical protein N475_19950 [Pseudoalteromonas luteoviolacea DSM 6061]KZN53741.1 hypothetical protein N474_19410 [Pseudoalteromonas luteoviolacea CPMOR-2]MBE0389559.1 hypothetical protein [Pseudoalteromonas luteoviolacea DSM 6061]TQF67794.1 hypothetical protein FLM44_21690 [Pseudoalteromonas luteoviolacea]
MNHYVIKGHDYDAFRDAQDELVDLKVDNEDISAICDSNTHPLHDFLTNHVVKIIKSECLFLIILAGGAYTALNTGAIPATAIIVATVVLAMFSVWVSGMLGSDLVRYYALCRETTLGEKHPLVLHVEIEDEQSETLRKVIEKRPQLQMKQVC